jgi:hypothetical protein
LPDRENLANVRVRLPTEASYDVVDVRHLALVDTNCPKLVARHELPESREVTVKPRAYSFVPRVLITLPHLAPVLDEAIPLKLDEFGAQLVHEPKPGWRRLERLELNAHCRLRLVRRLLDDRSQLAVLFGRRKPVVDFPPIQPKVSSPEC